MTVNLRDLKLRFVRTDIAWGFYFRRVITAALLLVCARFTPAQGYERTFPSLPPTTDHWRCMQAHTAIVGLGRISPA